MKRPLLHGLRILLALLAVAITGAIAGQSAELSKMKIIFDTDIGGDIDDAWALGFIISHPEFEPLGITITDGNTPARARIACKLLHVTGHDNIPVAVGRKTNNDEAYQFSWAEDFQAKQPITQPAAEFIVETVKRYPGQVTLIATGPLQNVADALRLNPRLGDQLKRVVLMSGCVYGRANNQPAIAEWNVVSSTKDAQVVYGAGLPLTIVPLDSTTHVLLREDERDQVRNHASPLTHSLECLYRLWLDSPGSRMTLHDQLAVAETASPGTFFGKKVTVPLVVDDQGFTRIDPQLGKPTVVCLEPKRDAFMEYYIGQLTAQPR
ncbi:MAG: nucleoside hydrolase [Candidatus Omnitrophica bacterium]|nr:nucleoside hydrolase [Candidatus Omnitrophota bacterium]